MRQVAVWTGMSVVLLTAGCHWPWMNNPTPPPPPTPPLSKTELPAATELVGYLNTNAKKVEGFQADVDIVVRQNGQPFGLDGLVACQKPRSFRLKANIVGQPGVDLGSNDDEFWYWISKADPPYVFHCAYNDLPRVKQLPFPFQPDLVLTAMGLSEYDPAKSYSVRANGQTVELIEAAKSPQGQDVWKTTVFNRTVSGPGKPQVVSHILQDDKGQMLCRANVEEVTVDKATGAVLPIRVKLIWPKEKLELTMKFYRMNTTKLDDRASASLFSRRGLTAQTFDLARLADPPSPTGAVTQGTSVQRTGWGTKGDKVTR